MSESIKFLKGDKIFLRPLKTDDISINYQKWLNDPDISYWNSRNRFPISTKEMYNYIQNSFKNQREIILAVLDNITKKHIGNISLLNINYHDSNAEIAFLLGEKSYWGKGIMFEAGDLLIKHAFHQLNLNRVYCSTPSGNKSMLKLASKLNFKKEGIRRQAFFKHNSYFDIIEFGILKNEIL